MRIFFPVILLFPFFLCAQEPIVVWAKQNKMEAVRDVLRKDPNLVRQLNADGENILNAPAKLGHEEMVSFLIARGADPELPLRYFETRPLHGAAEVGDLKMAALLIDRYKANVNVENRNGETPLMLAALKGNVQMMDLLVLRRAKVNVKDRDGRTALLKCVVEEPEEEAVAVRLIRYGSAMNILDHKGYAAIHYAVEQGQIKVLEALFREKDDPNRLSEDGKSPLWIAVKKKEKESVACLLKHGAVVTEVEMELAGKGRRGEILELLTASVEPGGN